MEEHTLELRVRYAEVDRQDVVYHAHYLPWFDLGRTEYLRACGACYAELESQGLLLMVTRAEVRYLSPARLDDRLLLRTRPAWRTRSRLCFEYQVLRQPEGRLLATGSTELCCVVRGGKPRSLPPEVEAALAHLPLGRPEKPLAPDPQGEPGDRSASRE